MNSQTLGYKPSAPAIELTSLKAIAGTDLSLSSWCIASVYIYHFSTVIDFPPQKYSGSAGQREISSEVADGETRTPVEPLYFSGEKSTTAEKW